MEVIIQIINKEGTVVMEHQADALHPTQFKRHPDKPIENETSTITGDHYNFFGFTYQPHVQLTGKPVERLSGPPETPKTGTVLS